MPQFFINNDNWDYIENIKLELNIIKLIYF